MSEEEVHRHFEMEIDFNELLARTIERAYALRGAELVEDKPHTETLRRLSLVITHLEMAALWKCEQDAAAHLGEGALLDWLRGI